MTIVYRVPLEYLGTTMRIPLVAAALLLLGCDRQPTQSVDHKHQSATHSQPEPEFDLLESMFVEQSRGRFTVHPSLPILLDTATGDTWWMTKTSQVPAWALMQRSPKGSKNPPTAGSETNKP